MNLPDLLPGSRLGLGLALVFVAACAPRPLSSPPPEAGLIPRLQAAVDEDPLDWRRAALLGGAFVARERPEDAEVLLAQASRDRPEAAELQFLAGLASEASGNPRAARGWYGRYVASQQDVTFRSEARGRLDRLDREALPDEVPQALPSDGDGAVGDSLRIVVLPFDGQGAGERLPELALAAGAVLAADLASISSLHVVDREVTRAVLSNLHREDPDEAVLARAERVGRLLGAGVVVVGRIRVIDETRVGLDATLVTLGEDGAAMVLPSTIEAPWFWLSVGQRRLTLFLLEALRVSGREGLAGHLARGWGESRSAWESLGSGLAEWDRGQVASAAASFGHAAELDHNFRLATRWNARARYYLEAGRPPSEVAWTAARQSVQRAMAASILADGTTPHGVFLDGLGVRGRSALAEALGQDEVGVGTLVELILTPSGGQP